MTAQRLSQGASWFAAVCVLALSGCGDSTSNAGGVDAQPDGVDDAVADAPDSDTAAADVARDTDEPSDGAPFEASRDGAEDAAATDAAEDSTLPDAGEDTSTPEAGPDTSGADTGQCVVVQLSISPAVAWTVPCLPIDYVVTAYCVDGSQADVTDQVIWSFPGHEQDVELTAPATVACGHQGFSTDVIAELAGCTASAALTCASSDPFVQVTPAEATITVGATVSFQALAVDSCATMDWTESIGWTSSDPSIASIAEPGVALGLSPGVVTISTTWMLGGSDATLTVVLP